MFLFEEVNGKTKNNMGDTSYQTILQLLEKEKSNNKLLDKVKSMITDYKIKEANGIFSNIMCQEIQQKCLTSKPILVILQHYSSQEMSSSYSVRIQTQSISRICENNKIMCYINDRLFLSDKEIFNIGGV